MFFFKSGADIDGVSLVGHQAVAVLKLDGEQACHACVVCKVLGLGHLTAALFPGYEAEGDLLILHFFQVFFYKSVELGLIYLAGSQLDVTDPFAVGFYVLIGRGCLLRICGSACGTQIPLFVKIFLEPPVLHVHLGKSRVYQVFAGPFQIAFCQKLIRVILDIDLQGYFRTGGKAFVLCQDGDLNILLLVIIIGNPGFGRLLSRQGRDDPQRIGRGRRHKQAGKDAA